MSWDQPMRVFPRTEGSMAAALADDPVTIDGLKVVFDERVVLTPVGVRPDSEEERDGRAR